MAPTNDSSRRQGRYWLLTIPERDYSSEFLPPSARYLRGQLELGNDTGYRHWQLLVIYSRKVSLRTLKSDFGQSCHAELSRSAAADAYVWKEDTRVDGTQFELGQRTHRPNSKHDWDAIWESAKKGDLESIPSSVRVQSYRTLRSISADFAQPLGMERTINVFWGATGTGKSRRAWSEAGMDAYSKDPRTKFWCGYCGQTDVVIDEFRGGIDIAHLLRWFDRYPVVVELKGSSTPLRASRIFITSNLPPSAWYPDLDPATYSALERRLNIIEFV